MKTIQFLRGVGYGILLSELGINGLWYALAGLALVWVTSMAGGAHVEERLNRLEGSAE